MSAASDATPKQPQEVLIVLCQDQSGSMMSVRKQTIDGFNEYIGGLKKDTNGRYLMTLIQFATSGAAIEKSWKMPFESLPIAEVPDLTEETYLPTGNTPLYDAVGAAIRSSEKVANGRPVLMVIQTDGQENASREWSYKAVRDLIEEKQKPGSLWTVVFMGADMDAWAVAQGLGVQMSNTVRYRGDQTGAVYRVLRAATSNYAVANSGDLEEAEEIKGKFWIGQEVEKAMKDAGWVPKQDSSSSK